MFGIECPFYPGRICNGACDNHQTNKNIIQKVADDEGVDPQVVISSTRTDPFRFFRAKGNRFFNPEAAMNCDLNLNNWFNFINAIHVMNRNRDNFLKG